MNTNNMMSCQNCDVAMKPQYKFCHQCGQSVVSIQKPLKPVLKDMFHEMLDIDGKVLITLKAMLFKPGLMSKAYCAGKRMKYTPPLRLYLVISFISLLTLNILDSYDTRSDLGVHALKEFGPAMMFVMLPLFAVILKLMYGKTYFLSNLIFSIHIHCVIYFVYIFIFAISLAEFWSLPKDIISILLFLELPLVFYLLIYIAFALKRFYQQSWIKTLMKWLILIMTYLTTAYGIFQLVMITKP